MSTSAAVLDHGSTTLHQLDPTLFDLNLLHPTGVQDHLSSVDFTHVDTHFLAQGGLDDLQIEDPESATAGISFDELEGSNAQSIGRKVGFLIILVQLITVIAKGLGSRPGGFAMAYGQGGGIATRLICTAAAVVMLSDFRVIPPIVDAITQGILWVWNYTFGAISEDSSGYSGGY